MLGNQVWINYGNMLEERFEPLVGNISVAFRNEKFFKSRSAGTIAECPLLGGFSEDEHNHIPDSENNRETGRVSRTE